MLFRTLGRFMHFITTGTVFSLKRMSEVNILYRYVSNKISIEILALPKYFLILSLISLPNFPITGDNMHNNTLKIISIL